MISVHDNSIYGYYVNCVDRRLTLHTEFRGNDPDEFTDVEFSGVEAHYFEHVLKGNILFDVTEIDVARIVDGFSELFEQSWKWSWPSIDYDGNLTVLKQRLVELQVCGFEIQSSLGMSGWVLARSCIRRRRENRALLT